MSRGCGDLSKKSGLRVKYYVGRFLIKMGEVNIKQDTKVYVIFASEAPEKVYFILENLEYVKFGEKRSERDNKSS